MVKNVNHLVRKWYSGHLGHLKTFGDGQARFSRGFSVNTTLAHVWPQVNETTFSAPTVALGKAILLLESVMPCGPGHVGTQCSAWSRGQCPSWALSALLPQAPSSSLGPWASSPQGHHRATRANSTHPLPLSFPAADVNWSHGHPGERPSHGHLPLLLRQCSEWGLWDNDLPNKGSGFSFAGIAA